MFTGLIETTGTIARCGGGALTVRPEHPFAAPVRGESIAVNGCCLTLEHAAADGSLTFHTLAETLRRTNLAALAAGGRVNLERALRVGDRCGGHFVQGHVDTVGTVVRCERRSDGDFELAVTFPAEFAREAVPKGAIAIDGVSLTIAELPAADTLSVRLIPETLAVTALADRAAGGAVNLEFDILGKYVLRQLEMRSGGGAAENSSGGVTAERLREAGFLDL